MYLNGSILALAIAAVLIVAVHPIRDFKEVFANSHITFKELALDCVGAVFFFVFIFVMFWLPTLLGA